MEEGDGLTGGGIGGGRGEGLEEGGGLTGGGIGGGRGEGLEERIKGAIFMNILYHHDPN